MLLYYVPTITSEKNVPTSTERIISKTSFHVDIFEAEKMGENKLIGTASVVVTFLGDSDLGDSEYFVNYIRLVSKYENTSSCGSTYSHLTLDELNAEHDEIVEACKELKKAWG